MFTSIPSPVRALACKLPPWASTMRQVKASAIEGLAQQRQFFLAHARRRSATRMRNLVASSVAAISTGLSGGEQRRALAAKLSERVTVWRAEDIGHWIKEQGAPN